MLRLILVSARPWSFMLTASTVAVGTVLALQTGSFYLWRLLVVLVGTVSLHAAMNLINDYFDVKHGVDTPDVATAQYRPHPLVDGTLQPRHIVTAAAVFYTLGIGLGIALGVIVGWPLLALLALGALISYFYTAEPINFKRRAMGELVMFVATGPLMLTGVYYTQTGSWENLGSVLLVSVPMGLWWTLPLVANNMKDIETDRETLGETLATKLGPGGSLVFYSIIAGVIYAVTALGIVLGAIPLWGVLVYITLPSMIRLIQRFAQSTCIPADADPKTVQIEIPFTALLVTAYLLQYYVPLPTLL